MRLVSVSVSTVPFFHAVKEKGTEYKPSPGSLFFFSSAVSARRCVRAGWAEIGKQLKRGMKNTQLGTSKRDVVGYVDFYMHAN